MYPPDGVADSPVVSLPAGTLSSTSPIVKRKKLSLKRPREVPKEKKKKRLIKMPKYLVKVYYVSCVVCGGIHKTVPEKRRTQYEIGKMFDNKPYTYA